jgi:hypothetical protein
MSQYFETVAYSEQIEAGGEAMTFHDTHRPLSGYFAALDDAGFLTERLLEPRPDELYAAEHAAARRWQSRPGFLHIRATLDSQRKKRPGPESNRRPAA